RRGREHAFLEKNFHPCRIERLHQVIAKPVFGDRAEITGRIAQPRQRDSAIIRRSALMRLHVDGAVRRTGGRHKIDKALAANNVQSGKSPSPYLAVHPPSMEMEAPVMERAISPQR